MNTGVVQKNPILSEIVKLVLVGLLTAAVASVFSTWAATIAMAKEMDSYQQQLNAMEKSVGRLRKQIDDLRRDLYIPRYHENELHESNRTGISE